MRPSATISSNTYIKDKKSLVTDFLIYPSTNSFILNFTFKNLLPYMVLHHKTKKGQKLPLFFEFIFFYDYTKAAAGKLPDKKIPRSLSSGPPIGTSKLAVSVALSPIDVDKL